ncbi:MAG: hypothetical protein COB36_11075 [Alphaproteobacteria bacterium]|nr:MAG: hypothetical protein COB36_11075 [Alphaproteobacteria bacterium]
MQYLKKHINYDANLKSGLGAPSEPPAFSLLDENPLLWFKPDLLSSLTTTGNNVDQIDDQSGNGRDAIYTPSAPQTNLDTINDLNVLTFTGDGLRVADVALGLVDIFLVFNTADTKYTPFLSQSDQYVMLLESGSVNTITSLNAGSPSYYKNGVLQTATNRGGLYAEFDNQDVVVLIRNADMSNWDHLNIGNHDSVPTEMDALFGEMAIFEAAKTNEAINKIGNYFNRWGLNWTDI